MSPTDPQGLYDQKDKGKNGVEWGVGVSLSVTVLRGMMRTREMAVGAAEGADWKGTLESVGLWEESDMSTGQGAEQLPEDSLLTVVFSVGKEVVPCFLGQHQKNLEPG